MRHRIDNGLAASEPGEHVDNVEPISATTKRRLAAALLAVFIGGLDLTVIATILPRMIFDLNVNTADVDRYIWVVNGYLIAYTVAIPIVGRVSDLVGRRLAFTVALSIFVIGSLWCALAQGLGALIIGRSIQGLGGGALLPVTMALVGDLLPPSRRTAALGIVGAVDTLGWVLGPLWGAAIVSIFGNIQTPWRLVFYINIPLAIIAAAAILVAARGTSSVRHVARIRRLDIIGTLFLGAALVLVNLGLSSGGEVGGGAGSGLRALGGTANPLAKYLGPFLGATAVFVVLFIFWERRVDRPIVPLPLFRIHEITAALLANLAVGAALIVAMVDVPLVIALVVKEDRVSSISALMLLPFTALMAILSLGGGVIASRFSERATAIAGMIGVTIGYIVLWGVFKGDHYLGMLPGLIISGAGFGLVIAPIASTVINAAPARDRGVAAGLTMVFRLLGMTVGISALTAFGVHRLQSLIDAMSPPVKQQANQTTADFLLQQQQFIQKHAIPASIQVVRETFLIAAGLTLIAVIPVLFMRRGGPPSAQAEEEYEVESKPAPPPRPPKAERTRQRRQARGLPPRAAPLSAQRSPPESTGPR